MKKFTPYILGSIGFAIMWIPFYYWATNPILSEMQVINETWWVLLIGLAIFSWAIYIVDGED